MQAPKTPKKVLPRPTLPEVHKLLEAAPSAKARAIVAVLTDTSFRVSEVAGIKAQDINWERQTVKIWGKGSKERVGRFGEVTARYLRDHLASYSPNGGNIWGIGVEGIRTLLKRLEKATGVKCNPHAFRRAWAIESIKQGVNLIDVQVLGGWEGLEMVKRYAWELDSEYAITRYKPLL